MSTQIHHTIRLGLVLLLALGTSPSSAHHVGGHDQNPNPPAVLGPTDVIHFEAGSLIIPMDGCYQRPSFMSGTDVEDVIAPYSLLTAWCNGASDKDDGLIPAYTLMFRLIQQGIPVNWAILSGKTSFHSVDFSVVRASGAPVLHRHPGAAATNRYSLITTVRYRGAPFVISAEYADEALALIDSFAGTCDTGTCYSDVDIHVAQSGFDAPIYRVVESMPKLGILDLTDPATSLSEATNMLQGSVTEALMADLEGTFFDWVTIPEVMSDALTAGDYDLVWVPPFSLDNPPTAQQQAFVDKLAAFADEGGSLLFQDAAIGALEGYGSMSGLSYIPTAPTSEAFMTAGAGTITNGTSSTWDNGDNQELTKGQDYSDPPSQFGGIVWTGIGGSQYNWKPRYDFAYGDGVRRMIYSDSTIDPDDDNWDFATWRKKDNDADKGTIYYLGGFHWRRVTAAGFRVLMNTLLATPAGPPEEIFELARSSPVVAIVGGTEIQYQGTFETEYPPETPTTYASAADDDSFQFPGTLGHMRAIDLAQLPEGQTTFADMANTPGLVIFDATNHIPPVDYTGNGCAFPADGTCRRIFTDVVENDAYVEKPVTTGNVSVLKPMIDASLTDAEANTVIARIHAGRYEDGQWVSRLGGVDRSTLAVIEPSPLIPNGRATILYFGGTDGMLHAVCAEAGIGCPAAGTELWAFLPSSELPKVVTNTARVDGSPKVADVFGDFEGGKAMRTVLTFQTGNRNASATYALDVTVPTEPAILWKYETPGPGIGLAMGWVKDGGTILPLTFVQSAAAPAAASGMEVRAIRTDTGDLQWEKTIAVYDYPNPRSDVNPEVPSTGIPGGVTLLPGDNGSTVEHVLVPTLYGQVFKLGARDGENEYGTTALFDFGEDFHPIGASVSLYRNEENELRGLVVSGGFADPFAPSGTEWAPDDVNQYAVGFPVFPEIEGETPPITRAQVESSGGALGLHIDFGAGQRAFSPAVIAGGEVFITTDTENVNAADYGSTGDSGRLWRAGLEGGASPTYVAIPSGAASVDVSITSGSVVTGGGSGVHRNNPAGFDATGSSTEVAPETSSQRRLWLRLR